MRINQPVLRTLRLGDTMESLWSKTEKIPKFPKLQQDIKADVLIIGGGMAGILCAYQLREAGISAVLVEQNTLCSGVTGKTTAKITSQHGLIYESLLRRFGLEQARNYYLANQEALRQYRELCKGMDCDFEIRDNFVYAREHQQKLLKEFAALQTIGAEAEWVASAPLPLSTVGAIRFPEQAQFHPLKFVRSIIKDLQIFEHTKVQSFDGNRYHTDTAVITAKKTIVATHFPLWNKHGLFPLKMYQHRSYVLALEQVGRVDGMYVDEKNTGLSFRSAGDLLLLGGGGHRTGKKGGGWEELEEFAKRNYPKAKIRDRWATQDCMTLDGVPYIGQYSPNTPDLLVATGFGKWGMTSSMVAANILTDLIQGKKNPYAALFSPSRSMLRPQLAVNAAESAWNLLTPTAPRCPHLGCALKWNKQEHSWDCPCHGSRFDEDGKVLDNPATGDLKNRPK